MKTKAQCTVNYFPGFLCPECHKDRLEHRTTEAGNHRAYCLNCGFWDYLEDDYVEKVGMVPSVSVAS